MFFKPLCLWENFFADTSYLPYMKGDIMYNYILETIGKTPLVRINRMNSNSSVTMFAKLEGLNPTVSIKDRKTESRKQKTGDKMYRIISRADQPDYFTYSYAVKFIPNCSYVLEEL